MKQKIYKVNENYFDTLNNNNAYILGLLSADGNISKEGNRITLSICDKDSEILQIILNHIHSTYPITEYVVKKKYKQKIFRITSKKLCEKLSIYGIVPKKSLKLKFPDINCNLISDYIRGYFDGDGSITITKSNNIAITILGTKEFTTTLKELYNKKFNNSLGWVGRHNKSKIYHFCLHGNICGKQFLEWIYDFDKSSMLFFKRKYNIYQNFILKN